MDFTLQPSQFKELGHWQKQAGFKVVLWSDPAAGLLIGFEQMMQQLSSK